MASFDLKSLPLLTSKTTSEAFRPVAPSRHGTFHLEKMSRLVIQAFAETLEDLEVVERLLLLLAELEEASPKGFSMPFQPLSS